MTDERHDELPEDLDVTAYVGPYTFPDIRRRRIPAVLYLVLGIASFALGVSVNNGGFVAGGVLVALVGVYSWIAAWPLRIDQTDALATASRTVGFPVGHASAQRA